MCTRNLIALIVPLALCLLLAAGCGTDEDGGSNGGTADTGAAGDTGAAEDAASADADANLAPAIESVTISPPAIALADTGQTDASLMVQVTVSGFDGALAADTEHLTIATVIDQETREALFEGGLTLEDDTFTARIRYTWFGGAEPGTYPIDVTVRSDAGEVVRSTGATTMTITE